MEKSKEDSTRETVHDKLTEISINPEVELPEAKVKDEVLIVPEGDTEVNEDEPKCMKTVDDELTEISINPEVELPEALLKDEVLIVQSIPAESVNKPKGDTEVNKDKLKCMTYIEHDLISEASTTVLSTLTTNNVNIQQKELDVKNSQTNTITVTQNLLISYEGAEVQTDITQNRDNSKLHQSSKSTLIAIGETSQSIQNSLIEEVEKLEISEKIGNRRNDCDVIVKKESESLRNLLVYRDDDDSDDEDDDINQKTVDIEKIAVSHSSSSSTSSDSESDSDPVTIGSDSDTSESEITVNTKAATKKAPDETFISETPQVADLSILNIDYDHEEFSHIGEISGIIDKIVTVTTISGTPVYDLGSILFVDDNASKKPLGEIFDVIGPVCAPVYCIGFHSPKEIEELGIKPKMKVYSAPKSNLSHYVFLKQLLEAKHTDASGSDNDSSSDEDLCGSEDDRFLHKRKAPKEFSQSDDDHTQNRTKESNRGRQNLNHFSPRQAKQSRRNSNQHMQSLVGGRNQNTFAPNFAGGSFDPSVPPPQYNGDPRWYAPPNMPPPSYWNGWSTSPGVMGSPQQWNNNPRPPANLRTPPPHWNNYPRLNMPPPPAPQFGWNNPTQLNENPRMNNSTNLHPAYRHWQPRAK